MNKRARSLHSRWAGGGHGAKTTNRLPEALHRQLLRLSKERGQSLDELVRESCERQYDLADREARLAAVEALATMRVPVGPVEQMIAESVSEPQNLPD